MKLICVFICIAVQWFSVIWGQNNNQFRQNQYQIDKNYTGIGPIHARPKFGYGIEVPNAWYGVNILSDVFEIKYLMGQANKIQPINLDDEMPPADYGSDYGYMLSLGANIPLNLLTVGAYHHAFNQWRGHTTLGIGLGYGQFIPQEKINGKVNLYFMEFAPGYRFRFPYASLEFNLNMHLGFSGAEEGITNYYSFYKGSSIYPSFTLRFDGFKAVFNPHMVSAKGSLTTVSNVKTNTTYNGSSRRGNQRIDYYTTTTTADVTVTPMNIGIQDIGPYFGLGPKVSLMNPKRQAYTNLSILVGAVAEMRMAAFDFGLTLEGGQVGLGSELEFKGVNNPRRKLDKDESSPVGSVNVVNFYANIGMDISPLFLLPLGITYDKGDATSFFSATMGLNVGIHQSFNPTFDDPTSSIYFQELINDNPDVNPRYLDPSLVGFGYLGGFYFSLQVGAVDFKVTNYRYYRAPFASNTMLSIAYRFMGLKNR